MSFKLHQPCLTVLAARATNKERWEPLQRQSSTPTTHTLPSLPPHEQNGWTSHPRPKPILASTAPSHHAISIPQRISPSICLSIIHLHLHLHLQIPRSRDETPSPRPVSASQYVAATLHSAVRLFSLICSPSRWSGPGGRVTARTCLPAAERGWLGQCPAEPSRR